MKRPLCQLACQWCASPVFWLWANVEDAKQAKAFVSTICGIESRKELDVSPIAAEIFHQAIRKPFMASMEKQDAITHG